MHHFNKFVYALLTALCITNVITEAALPWILEPLFRLYGRIEYTGMSTFLPFFFSGIFTFLILFELRRMMKTVLTNEAFVAANIRSLKRMSLYAAFVVVLMIIRIIVNFTIAGFCMAVVFALAGMFSYVISAVFEQAVAYKEDNDLTI